MKTISLDLRKRIIAAFDAGDETREAIARRFMVSLGMVKKLIQQRKSLGHVHHLYERVGRHRRISPKQEEQLGKLLAKNPSMTLEELRRASGVDCTLTTVHRALARMRMTYKKSLKASEQERPDVREAREQWRREAPHFAMDRVVFLDETGAKTNMTRFYGRGPKGERVHDSVPSGHWNTTTLVAAVRGSGPIAPLLLEGAIDGEAFLIYVEKVLAPSLGPGDILVMDNLSTHKSKAARHLIEATGASILDLPAYSPDLNPIEKMWSKIKAHLRMACARTADALTDAVKQALDAITTSDIQGWFRSCGYVI